MAVQFNYKTYNDEYFDNLRVGNLTAQSITTQGIDTQTFSAVNGSFTNLTVSDTITAQAANIQVLNAPVGNFTDITTDTIIANTGTFQNIITQTSTESITANTGTFQTLVTDVLTANTSTTNTGNFQTINAVTGNITTGNFQTVNTDVINATTGNFQTVNANAGNFQTITATNAVIPGTLTIGPLEDQEGEPGVFLLNGRPVLTVFLIDYNTGVGFDSAYVPFLGVPLTGHNENGLSTTNLGLVGKGSSYGTAQLLVSPRDVSTPSYTFVDVDKSSYRFYAARDITLSELNLNLTNTTTFTATVSDQSVPYSIGIGFTVLVESAPGSGVYMNTSLNNFYIVFDNNNTQQPATPITLTAAPYTIQGNFGVSGGDVILDNHTFIVALYIFTSTSGNIVIDIPQVRIASALTVVAS